MTDLERAIQAIENGLLEPRGGEDTPREKMALEERMSFHNVPGFSISLIEGGELVWAKGYGVTDVKGKEPVTPETIFQAGSISKPVSAMVALHLVEQGLLELDTDINDKLRSWKVPDSKHTQPRRDGTQPVVTLRGLLSHTAGFTIRGYVGYTSDRELPTLLQILNGEKPANSRQVRLVQKPDKSFKYSGGGYMVLEQLLEDVTGRSLVDLAQEIIFDQLGMENSTFQHHLPQKFLPQAAIAHNPKGKQVKGKWHIYPEHATASLWSTPTDLARLVVEVIHANQGESNRILSQQMTHQMLTPQMHIGGLGFLIIQSGGRTRFEHPGWNAGYHSLLIGDLVTGQGVTWMTNGENGKLLGWEVTRGLAGVFGWTWN